MEKSDSQGTLFEGKKPKPKGKKPNILYQPVTIINPNAEMNAELLKSMKEYFDMKKHKKKWMQLQCKHCLKLNYFYM